MAVLGIKMCPGTFYVLKQSKSGIISLSHHKSIK